MSAVYDHIGLATQDLDRSIAFYRDVMGFEFSTRRRLRDGREQAAFLLGECTFILFRAPHGRYVEKVRRPRSGVHHLAFALEPKEYDAVIEGCKAGGVKIMRQALNRGARGLGLATYFYDPDGNDIEIKKYEELPEKSPNYSAKGFYM